MVKAVASRLKIELDDGEFRVMKLIDQAHHEKSTIRGVRIEYWGEEGGVRLSVDQYHNIFRKIGNLPNLTEIYLHFTHSAPSLPVTALQKLIYRHVHDHQEEDHFDDYTRDNVIAARRLEYLSLHHVILSGSEEEFSSLGESLQSNRSLQKVYLSGCSSVGPIPAAAAGDNSVAETTPDAGQDPIHLGMSVILQALAHLPSLSSIRLEKVCYLSCDAVIALCQSSNLHLLELFDVDDDLNHYGPAMAYTLQTSSLQTLEISSNLQSVTGNAIARMLEANSSLRTLGFDIDYSDYGESLAQVLQEGHNRTLERLNLRVVGSVPVSEDDMEEEAEEQRNEYFAKILGEARTIFQSLAHNTSLEHLHINFYTIGPDTVQEALVKSLVELLEVNFVLRNLTLRGNHMFADLGPQVGFRLRLNRAGLYQLLLGEAGVVAPRSKWVEAILASQNDLDIVFHLLSTNPSLCCGGNPAQLG